MSGTIGRSGELASIDGVLRGAVDGAGSLLLVRGEAGIGKTHLLDLAVRRAEQLDLAVRACAGEPLDHGRPFAAIERALGPFDAGARRYRVQEAIVDRVEALAAEQALLLLVDDLQWVDEPTLAALAMVGRRASELPVALLLAARPTPPLPEPFADHLVELGAHVVAPPPLTAEEVEELTADALGAVPDGELRSLLAGAHGNPFLVLELVRTLADEDALEVDGGVVRSSFHGLPPPLRQTVLRRVRSRCPDATDVLRVGAVLGGSFDIDDLAAVLDRSPASLHSAVAEALDACLLEEDGSLLRYRHELIRESVYADIPTAIRASLHRLAADALTARGHAAPVVAGHLIAGGGGPGAVERLGRAAGELAASDAVTALEVLDRALELAPDGHPDLHQMRLERVHLLAALGRLADAEAQARELVADPTAVRVRVGTGLALAEVLLLAGNAPDAVRALEQAHRSGVVEDQQAGLLRADLAWARLASFDLDGATADAEAALRWSEAHADPQIGASAFAVQCRLAAFTVDFDAAVELGRRAVELGRDTAAAWRRTPHFYLGLALLNSDRPAEARAVLAEGRQLAEAHGVPAAVALYHAATISCGFHEGAWDDATAEAEAARLLHTEVGTRRELLQMEAMLGLMWFHRGEYAEAERARDRAEADFAAPGHDAGGVIWLLWLRATFAEAAGELERAVGLVGTAFDLAVDLAVHSVKLWFGPEVVRLALAAGDRDTAARVAAEVEAVAGRASTASAAGATEFCGGLLSGDDAAFERAADAFRRANRRRDVAVVCEARAEVLAARGGSGQAAAGAFAEAAAAFEHLGADHDLRRVRARMRELGVRRGSRERRGRPTTGLASLTPAERSVLELVQQGLANRAIAERLYISRRTVETHVGRLYSKLAVPNRIALATLDLGAGADPVRAAGDTHA